MGSSQTKNQHTRSRASSSVVTDHQMDINDRESTMTHNADPKGIESIDTYEDRRARFICSTDSASSTNSSTGISNTSTRIISECNSCDLSNEQESCDWERDGPESDLLQTALNFKRELKLSNDRTKALKKKMSSINRGYMALRLDHIENKAPSTVAKVRELFKEAEKKSNPDLIIKAYTLSKTFSGLLNGDMARIVKHDINNGCSKFSCDILYTTQDATKSIANILYNHLNLIKYPITLYRGMALSNELEHCQIGSYIMTNTFLSTSQNSNVANDFLAYNSSDQNVQTDNRPRVLFFCTYIIKNLSDYCVAVDISTLSQFPEEEEVLLLPYSVFRITNRKTIPLTNPNYKRIEIELEDCSERELVSVLNHS